MRLFGLSPRVSHLRLAQFTWEARQEWLKKSKSKNALKYGVGSIVTNRDSFLERFCFSKH